ncbi:hypothetical protein WJX73_003514 [Symbiochloris irregularis]|uniref:Fatty acyl-CoA reductase n=1 Tax=Symbiochloris irregularis TaxID=706552 RepID=A0AAW1NR27_9CHLO
MLRLCPSVHKVYGAHVEEMMYPLGFLNGSALDHSHIAAAFADLTPQQAEEQTAKYLKATGHTNTYTLSKHMTEEVIRDLHRAGVPCTIVRPSAVGAVANSPCPGYFGHTVSILVALFLGYSTGMSTFTPHNPSNAIDVVPGDICAATILAASAAVIQGKVDSRMPEVVHATTTTTYLHAFMELMRDNVCPYWGARKPWYVRSLHQAVRTPWRFPLAQDTPLFRAWTAAKTCKFWALACMLTLMGQQRKALQITKGWQACMLYNTEKLDFHLFFCSRNARRLQASLSQADIQAGVRIVWDKEHGDWHSYYTQFQAAVNEV